MSLMDAIKTCFSKYADFSGRARRSEYWYFFLFNFLVSSALTYLGQRVSDSPVNLFSTIGGLFSLALLVPGLAVCCRRLHDIGRSGWSMLYVLIPLVGPILLLVWLCQDSQPGVNQYGPNPKGSSPGSEMWNNI